MRSPDASPDLLWRYLDYLVCQQGNDQPELHTELALQLADAAMRLMASHQDKPSTGMSHQTFLHLEWLLHNNGPLNANSLCFGD